MKKAVIVAAALAAVLALGGCASGGATSGSSAASSADSASSSASSEAVESASASSGAADSSGSSAASSSASAQAAESSQAASSSSASASSGSTLSESAARQLIEDNGYGSIIDMEETTLPDGVRYWHVTASLSDGSVHEYYVDPQGTVTSADEDGGSAVSSNGASTSNKLTEKDLENIVWEQGLGELVSSKKTTLEDGVEYWQISTRGADGKTTTFMVAPDGNVSRK